LVIPNATPSAKKKKEEEKKKNGAIAQGRGPSALDFRARMFTAAEAVQLANH